MTAGPCALAPCASPVLRERWRQKLLRAFRLLREQEQVQGRSFALGRIHHTRACTLRNMHLSQSCLVLVLEGTKTLLSGEAREGEVVAGGALFLPAGGTISCVNTPDASGEYLALTVCLDAALVDRVRQRLALATKCDPGDGPATKIKRSTTPLWECAHNFMRLLAGDDPMLPLMQQEQMVYILWTLGMPVFAGPHRLVSAIRALVEAAPQEAWGPSELAERLFMTERTLRRHLDNLGTSPSELVRVSRLHCGLDLLLRERMRIPEVAARCGYTSPSRFAARFRELFGISPAGVLASRQQASGTRRTAG